MHAFLQSKLSGKKEYVYSDNDYIFLGKIVEQITGMPLDEYVAETFLQTHAFIQYHL